MSALLSEKIPYTEEIIDVIWNGIEGSQTLIKEQLNPTTIKQLFEYVNHHTLEYLKDPEQPPILQSLLRQLYLELDGAYNKEWRECEQFLKPRYDSALIDEVKIRKNITDVTEKLMAKGKINLIVPYKQRYHLRRAYKSKFAPDTVPLNVLPGSGQIPVAGANVTSIRKRSLDEEEVIPNLDEKVVSDNAHSLHTSPLITPPNALEQPSGMNLGVADENVATTIHNSAINEHATAYSLVQQPETVQAPTITKSNAAPNTVTATIRETGKSYNDTATTAAAYANDPAGEDAKIIQETRALENEIEKLQQQKNAALTAHTVALTQYAELQAVATASKTTNDALSKTVKDAITATEKAQNALTSAGQATLAKLKAEKAQLIAQLTTTTNAITTQAATHKDVIAALQTGGDTTAVVVSPIQPINIQSDIDAFRKQVQAMKLANKTVEQSGRAVEKLDKQIADLLAQQHEMDIMNATHTASIAKINENKLEHDIEQERVRLERQAKIAQIEYNPAPAVATARAGYKTANDAQANVFSLRQTVIKADVEQAAIKKAKAINEKRVLTDKFNLDKMNAIEDARKRAVKAKNDDDDVIIGDLQSERDEILRVIEANVPSAVTDKKNEFKLDDDLRKKEFESEKTRIKKLKDDADLAAVVRTETAHKKTATHNLRVMHAKEAKRLDDSLAKIRDDGKTARLLKEKRVADLKAISTETKLKERKKKQVNTDKATKANLETLKKINAGKKEDDAMIEVERVSVEKRNAYKHAMAMMGVKEQQRVKLMREKTAKAEVDRLAKVRERKLELEPIESDSKKKKRNLIRLMTDGKHKLNTPN